MIMPVFMSSCVQDVGGEREREGRWVWELEAVVVVVVRVRVVLTAGVMCVDGGGTSSPSGGCVEVAALLSVTLLPSEKMCRVVKEVTLFNVFETF